MNRAVIVEDETNARDLLTHLCVKYCNLEIVGTADNIEDGEKLLRALKPEILFLDISLPGKNGFELLKRIQPLESQVIFVTAYNQFAIQAIKVSAVDYLLKPIEINELKSAVKKAVYNVQQKKINQQLNALIENMGAMPGNRKIAIPESNGMQYIEIMEIIRLKAMGRYTEVYLKSGKKMVVSRNLGEFEILLNPHEFIRVHHSHLINAKHVVAFEKSNGGHLKMTDGSTVEVSRRKKDELFNRLGFTAF